MKDDAARPEPDRVPGAPHPRETAELIGQATAERTVLEAMRSGRVAHAWLLTGPRGVGKATLAWRMARALLAAGEGQPGAAPERLAVAPDHPVARRVAALAEPNLALLRRGWDEDRKPPRLRAVITVDEVRRLKGFFGLSAGGAGRRVVIVDAADEMNPNAANALLKLLEEPPEGAVLILVSHQPARLLPTIRSRCRVLRLAPLGPEDMAAALAAAGHEPGAEAGALAALSGGSVGEALRLANQDGPATYAEILGLFSGEAGLDRPRAIRLAEGAAGQGREERFDLVLTLLDRLMARAAQAGAAGPPAPEAAEREAAALARLAPTPAAARGWAELAQGLGPRARRGRAVNLDPAALILDTILSIDRAAARLAAGKAAR